MILLQLIGITFLCVVAFKIATGEEMIFESFGNYCKAKVDEGKKIYMLLTCPYCMGSLFVIPAHLFALGLGVLPFEFSWQTILRWPLVVFGTSILAGFTWNIHETINAIKDRNEAQMEYYDRKEEIDFYEEDIYRKPEDEEEYDFTVS